MSDREERRAYSRMSLARETSTIQIGALVFCALGAVGSVVYAAQRDFDHVSVATCALATGGAAFLLGSLCGLLFGIPRAQAVDNSSTRSGSNGDAADELARYRPNTNLEQISDWLTKILIGVGLTQLAQAPHAASALAAALKPVLGNSLHSGGFGVALVVYFFVGGFIISYLWARLKLGAALREADLVDEHIRELEARIQSLEPSSHP